MGGGGADFKFKVQSRFNWGNAITCIVSIEKYLLEAKNESLPYFFVIFWSNNNLQKQILQDTCFKIFGASKFETTVLVTCMLEEFINKAINSMETIDFDEHLKIIIILQI